MTDAALDAVKGRHEQVWVGVPGKSLCEGYFVPVPYPCDVARLLAEVERLREENAVGRQAVETNWKLLDRLARDESGLQAILREHHEVETHGSAMQCCTCGPQEKRWPCITVLEARAALGGEE